MDEIPLVRRRAVRHPFRPVRPADEANIIRSNVMLPPVQMTVLVPRSGIAPAASDLLIQVTVLALLAHNAAQICLASPLAPRVLRLPLSAGAKHSGFGGA